MLGFGSMLEKGQPGFSGCRFWGVFLPGCVSVTISELKVEKNQIFR